MTHVCHAEGCNKAVPPKMLFCLRHWRMLPKRAQDHVWMYYRPGQEIDKRTSAAYLLVQTCAVGLVAFREKKLTVGQITERIAHAILNAVNHGVAVNRAETIVIGMGCREIKS